MLDFTNLPQDGIRFEQLVRDLLLRAGLRPTWTGVGADSGRDLLAIESLSGPLHSTDVTWLVDCKHYAHSGRSVGVADVPDIVDRCRRVNATGFLMATSTQPSSELSRKLLELGDQTDLVSLVWDNVEIENRLLTHTNYSLAQNAFHDPRPETWKIFYTEREERWTAHYNGCFLFVESRSGVEPPSLLFLEEIIAELDRIAVGPDEAIRVRAIWHDTPNGCFYSCWADYLVPASAVPTLTKYEIERQLRDNIDGQVIDWAVRLQITLPFSDYFDPDDDAFYSEFKEPLYHKIYRSQPTSTSAEDPDWWEVRPPKIRSFNDAHMWNEHREKHGFQDGMTMSPPYRKDNN
ncbi:MAG: restriction endonuclease [Parasphingopyxis sp.]|uniref:restriction endonuclease n=1 Tax=Parasphingopyxis sp. TaxID=1920299 RepID=UPI003F9F2456